MAKPEPTAERHARIAASTWRIGTTLAGNIQSSAAVKDFRPSLSLKIVSSARADCTMACTNGAYCANITTALRAHKLPYLGGRTPLAQHLVAIAPDELEHEPVCKHAASGFSRARNSRINELFRQPRISKYQHTALVALTDFTCLFRKRTRRA